MHGRGLTSLHTHSREEGRKDSHQNGGWLQGKQLPGHTGSALRGTRAQGGKGNQVWTGITHQRWSRRGVTVGNRLGSALRRKGPPKGQAACQAKEGTLPGG